MGEYGTKRVINHALCPLCYDGTIVKDDKGNWYCNRCYTNLI